VQVKLTLKALANVSPGLERSDNPGFQIEILLNPERVRRRQTLSGFQPFFFVMTQGSRYARTLG
jgi:hypothetical protein